MNLQNSLPQDVATAAGSGGFKRGLNKFLEERSVNGDYCDNLKGGGRLRSGLLSRTPSWQLLGMGCQHEELQLRTAEQQTQKSWGFFKAESLTRSRGLPCILDISHYG